MSSAILALSLTLIAGRPSCSCSATCQCVIPGHCGHTGCACRFVSGVWRPPADRWVTFTANPVYEVYGHEVEGVFRYTRYRLKAHGGREGAQFVVCRCCGAGQFLVFQYQQCSRCGMFLPRPSGSVLSPSPCSGGRCGR